MITPQARFLPFDLDLNPFNPLSESVDSVPFISARPARVSCLFPPGALTLSPFGPADALSLRHPALFAFGDKPSPSAHFAQDTALGHLFAETPEQAFL
jgi:hypothetical protein